MKKYIIYTVFLIIGSLSTILINQYIETSKIHTGEGYFPKSGEGYDDLRYEVRCKYRNNEIHLITDIYCDSNSKDRILDFFNNRNLFLIIEDEDGFLIEELELGLENYGWSVEGKYFNQQISVPMTPSNYKLIKKMSYSVSVK